MTAKKAIEFLRMHFEYLKERWKPHPDYNVLEAIRFAISALENRYRRNPYTMAVSIAREYGMNGKE